MTSSESSPEHRFIRFLMSLLGSSKTSTSQPDRAALAALRRSLGRSPGEVAETFPYVIPWCSHLPERRQDDYFLVAALFALHQGLTSPNPSAPSLLHNNFGASYRLVAERSGSASIEKRFLSALGASREELDNHLRHAISLMRANSVGVDWLQLLNDLRGWEHPDRYVQRHWAQGYWQKEATPATTPPAASPNSPATSE